MLGSRSGGASGSGAAMQSAECDQLDWVRYLIAEEILEDPSTRSTSPGRIVAASAPGTAVLTRQSLGRGLLSHRASQRPKPSARITAGRRGDASRWCGNSPA